MVKLMSLISELEINNPNKIKPYKQNESWFYFKDDEKDYHNFHYGGYWYAPNDKFYTRYPEGTDSIEARAAIEYLKRHNIPFKVEDKEVKFDGKYVNFDGFTKSRPIINELGINNPSITSLDQIAHKKNIGSWTLPDDIDRSTFISDLERIIKFNKGRYGNLLNKFIKPNRSYIITKDITTDELNDYTDDYYIGRMAHNKIKLICNSLKIELKNMRLISGAFFKSNLESNIYSSYRGGGYILSTGYFIYLKIDNLIFYSNGTTWCVLTPSQKIIYFKDININNQKDKRVNNKQVSDSLPSYKSIEFKITGLRNNVVYFDMIDKNQNKIYNKGNIKYDNTEERKYSWNDKLYTYINKCVLTLDQPINGINVSFRKKELNLKGEEKLKIGSRLDSSIIWNIESYLKKQTNKKIEPIDNDNEITKLINELGVNKPFYIGNKKEDWDLEALKKESNDNPSMFKMFISAIETLNLPINKKFNKKYIEDRLLELLKDSSSIDVTINFLLKYKIIK